MSDVYVLDASAILSFLYREKGGQQVYDLLPTAIVSAVNYAEVFTKLHDRGFSTEDLATTRAEFKPAIIEFDAQQAIATAALRNATKSKGLSLGDRACLALAASREAIAVTADGSWINLEGIPRILMLR